MADQQVAINFSTIRAKVIRNINVFAKRYSVQGENKFTFVALSSAEEALLGDFVEKAAHDVVSLVAQTITAYVTSTGVTFTSTNSRWGSVLGNAFSDAVTDYCITMAVADYFGLYFPNQANWYLNRANTLMSSILRLCYIKKPAEESVTSVSYGSVTVGDSDTSDDDNTDNSEITTP